MISAFTMIKVEAINAIFISLAVAYMVLVFLGYATEGPHYQFGLDVHHPIITAKRLLVGLGVRSAVGIFWLGQRLLDPLFEASTEVGDWFIDHTSPETRSHIRSRFI